MSFAASLDTWYKTHPPAPTLQEESKTNCSANIINTSTSISLSSSSSMSSISSVSSSFSSSSSLHSSSSVSARSSSSSSMGFSASPSPSSTSSPSLQSQKEESELNLLIDKFMGRHLGKWLRGFILLFAPQYKIDEGTLLAKRYVTPYLTMMGVGLPKKFEILTLLKILLHLAIIVRNGLPLPDNESQFFGGRRVQGRLNHSPATWEAMIKKIIAEFQRYFELAWQTSPSIFTQDLKDKVGFYIQEITALINHNNRTPHEEEKKRDYNAERSFKLIADIYPLPQPPAIPEDLANFAKSDFEQMRWREYPKATFAQWCDFGPMVRSILQNRSLALRPHQPILLTSPYCSQEVKTFSNTRALVNNLLRRNDRNCFFAKVRNNHEVAEIEDGQKISAAAEESKTTCTVVGPDYTISASSIYDKKKNELTFKNQEELEKFLNQNELTLT